MVLDVNLRVLEREDRMLMTLNGYGPKPSCISGGYASKLEIAVSSVVLLIEY
jgi:hypothetical protein